jgi:hypothetical protein
VDRSDPFVRQETMEERGGRRRAWLEAKRLEVLSAIDFDKPPSQQQHLSCWLDSFDAKIDEYEARGIPARSESYTPFAVRDLSPLPRQWRQGLEDDGRIRSERTIEHFGIRRVEARYWKPQTGRWGPWFECVGIPCVDPRFYKLWCLDRRGHVVPGMKLNAGAVDLIVSPEVRRAATKGEPIDTLLDCEGESDLLAAYELGGCTYVLTTTGGARAISAHRRYPDALRRLSIGEVWVVRDLNPAGAAGQEVAAAWWRELGVRTRILRLPGPPDSGLDLRDYLLARDRSGPGKGRHHV